MNALNQSIFIQLVFGNTTNASGSEIRVLWLNTSQTTKILITILHTNVLMNIYKMKATTVESTTVHTFLHLAIRF